MSPTSLFSVPPELLREHARHGQPALPKATISDRKWAALVCVALAVAVGLLAIALR